MTQALTYSYIISLPEQLREGDHDCEKKNKAGANALALFMSSRLPLGDRAAGGLDLGLRGS